MAAMAGKELDHVPPEVVLVQVAVDPEQSGFVPEIIWATGAVMVTAFVAVLTQPPILTE